jgi:argininosuccinate synthase
MHIRAAKATDIPDILNLIEEHVQRGDLLPRSPQSVRETLDNWFIGKDKENEIVACVSLHRYTPALAEVRSLAVSDTVKGQGFGRTIVKALIAEATRRNIPTLFALTRVVPFFQKLGFQMTNKERFPEKVWRDCQACPVYDNCDETAVFMHLSPVQPSTYIPVPIPVRARASAPVPLLPRETDELTLREKGVIPMSTTSVKKVVLAYSGGLDTSVIVPWLLREKALASGASKVYVEDLRHEFAKDFLFPMVQSGAIYEKQYLLGTSVARPLIAKWQVAIAEVEGADAVAHGATGKGNDQVRFELTYKALNPTLKVIAPWREWDIRSREDALAYAKAHNVPVVHTEKSIYSRDANLWHISHEGGILEDPACDPEESMFLFSTSPENAPDEPEVVKIDFEKGIPLTVNDVQLPPAMLIEKLNELGAKHGIGRVDLVENRLVGMKSRGVYETPGGAILYAAHRELESLCLDRDTSHYKEQIGVRYAELVYFGKWYHSLREALQSFVDKTQESVTGWVKLKLYKGNVIVVGRSSDNSLYREDFATFGQEDVYDQQDAVGFITLFGLQMKVKAMMEVSDGGRTRYAAPDYSKFKRD